MNQSLGNASWHASQRGQLWKNLRVTTERFLEKIEKKMRRVRGGFSWDLALGRVLGKDWILNVSSVGCSSWWSWHSRKVEGWEEGECPERKCIWECQVETPTQRALQQPFWKRVWLNFPWREACWRTCHLAWFGALSSGEAQLCHWTSLSMILWCGFTESKMGLLRRKNKDVEVLDLGFDLNNTYRWSQHLNSFKYGIHATPLLTAIHIISYCLFYVTNCFLPFSLAYSLVCEQTFSL